jgi:uncharacterized protein YijF (DUF1287 family)
MKNQGSSHTHLQAATSRSTDPSLQKSVSAQPKKNFKIFFSLRFKKIKTPDTQAQCRQQTHIDTITGRQKKKHMPITRAWRKWRVQRLNKQFCYYLTLVLGDSVVLRMPPLRQAPNRYKPF